MSKIVCFGEVLWDVFPTHKKIGGAPLNVATRSKSFNNEVAIISAIGNDELGKLILEYLEEHQINKEYVQVRKEQPLIRLIIQKLGTKYSLQNQHQMW